MSEWLLSFFNFLVFFIILVWVSKKKVKDEIDAKYQAFQLDVDRVKKLEQEVLQTKRDLDERLSKLDAEIQGVLDEAKDDAEAITKELNGRAESLSSHLKDDAVRSVEQYSQQLSEDLEARLLARALEKFKAKAQDASQGLLSGSFQKSFQNQKLELLENQIK